MDSIDEDGSCNMRLDKELGWGKSLPVPSVQEIVRNDSQHVPERFIKDYEDRPNMDSTFNSNFPNIPVIDFSLLINGDSEELNKLDFACKEWGFFQVIGKLVVYSLYNIVYKNLSRTIFLQIFEMGFFFFFVNKSWSGRRGF